MDSKLISLLLLGFALGIKHAFDTDHIVAVSTLIDKTKCIKRSSWLGVVWGIGHTSTLFLTGLLMLTFKITIPSKIALSFEFLVGIVLVALGLDLIRRVKTDKIHLHKHQHQGFEHIHIHSHKKSFLHNQSHKSFVVGMVHGLAGSAALVLLVLSTVQGLAQGSWYIAIFGLGSIIGMLATSTLIGFFLSKVAEINKIENKFKIFIGSASVVLGCMTMYEVGIVGRLLIK